MEIGHKLKHKKRKCNKIIKRTHALGWKARRERERNKFKIANLYTEDKKIEAEVKVDLLCEQVAKCVMFTISADR